MYSNNLSEAEALVGLMFLVFCTVAYIGISGLITRFLFKKAGVNNPNVAFVPIYRTYLIGRVAGIHEAVCVAGAAALFVPIIGWWFVLPVYTAAVGIGLALSFGRSGAFVVASAVAWWITVPIMAFDSSTYRGRGFELLNDGRLLADAANNPSATEPTATEPAPAATTPPPAPAAAGSSFPTPPAS